MDLTGRYANIERFDKPTGISREANDPNIGRSGIDSALDAEQKIRIDIPCRACGYSLRSLALDQACPECGVAVSASVPSNGLVFSNSRWLVRVARGCLFLPVTLFVAIACGMGLGFIEEWMLQPAQRVEWRFQLIVGAFQVAVTVLLVYAFWMLTLPEPGRNQRHIRWSTRRIARVLILSSLIVNALPGVVLQLIAFSAWPTIGAPGLDILRWTSSLLSSGCGLLGCIGLFFYAASMALRIPNDRLARRTDLVRWGLGCALVLGFILQLFPAVVSSLELYDWRNLRLLDFSYDALVVIAVVLIVLFGVWALILILQYREHLLRVVRLTSQLTKST